MAQAGIEMETLETPLLDEYASKAYNWFSSFWGGNNATSIAAVDAPALEMGIMEAGANLVDAPNLPGQVPQAIQDAIAAAGSTSCRPPK